MGQFKTLTASDGHSFKAYVAEQPGNTLSLVVVQEAFGVNQHIRDVCDRFAAQGFNAIAPALFDRVERDVESPYDEAGIARYYRIRKSLTTEQVLLDVQAAADALGATGIVGYCFGGTVTWWAATLTTRFRAASAWYGGGIYEARDATPNCPVQMHFGGKDAHITPAQVAAIEQRHPDIPVYVYPEADHGFGCDNRASFDPEAYAQAQARTLGFFRQHLA